MFLDPPILRQRVRPGVFIFQDHMDLADMLRHARSKWLLTIGDHPKIRKLPWLSNESHQEALSVPKIIGDRRPTFERVILRNYESPRHPLHTAVASQMPLSWICSAFGEVDVRIIYRTARAYRAALLAVARSRRMEFSKFMRMRDKEYLRQLSYNRNQLSYNQDLLDGLVRRFMLPCRHQVAVAPCAPTATNLSAESISSTMMLLWNLLAAPLSELLLTQG